MNKSRAYSGKGVNQVDGGKIGLGHEGQEAELGIDVGKFELQAVLRWRDGCFERPWRVKNPGEIPALLSLIQEMSQKVRLQVAMEPSGTYGDALRQSLADAGIALQRVEAKASHDYAEIFDGVPSQHDGKDAAVVAELCAIGKSQRWPYQAQEEWAQEMGYWVDRLDSERRLYQIWCGKIEGLLARHWPEATRALGISSVTLQKALLEYGSPAALAGDPEAAGKLRRWGRVFLKEELIQELIGSAAGSLGVRPTGWDQQRIRDYAARLLTARQEMGRALRRLKHLSKGQVAIQAMAEVIGVGSACVLWVCAGDPKDYFCGKAYLKALGLNLTERSSGIFQGKLRISKRGKAMSRRWLYFAALRWAKDPSVKPWYQQKKVRDGGEGKRALVAMMRKLALALYQVGGHGVAFEAARLFPGAEAARFNVAAVRR